MALEINSLLNLYERYVAGPKDQTNTSRTVHPTDLEGPASQALSPIFVEIGHEVHVLSTTILSLLLIQAGQLSVTGECKCT